MFDMRRPKFYVVRQGAVSLDNRVRVEGLAIQRQLKATNETEYVLVKHADP